MTLETTDVVDDDGMAEPALGPLEKVQGTVTVCWI